MPYPRLGCLATAGLVSALTCFAGVPNLYLNSMANAELRVVVTFAQSIDGRIATADGDSHWISGPESLKLAHRFRSENDAIMVGVGTVVSDDPELTCRLQRDGTIGRTLVPPTPARIVIDPHLRIPLTSRIVQTAPIVPTFLFCRRNALGRVPEKVEDLESRSIRLSPFDSPSPQIDPNEIVRRITALGFRSLMIEGGSHVITSFLRARVVGRLVVVVAPKIIGEGISAVGDLGVRDLAESIVPVRVTTYPAGADIVWDMDLNTSSVETSQDGSSGPEATMIGAATEKVVQEESGLKLVHERVEDGHHVRGGFA